MIQTIKIIIGLVQKVQIFTMVSKISGRHFNAKFNMISVINYFLIFSLWVDVRNSLLKRSNQLSFNTCVDLGIFARRSRLNCQKTALTFFFVSFSFL